MLSRVICHFLEQGSINAINSETNRLAFYRCSRKMSVFNACVRKGSKVPEEAMGLQMQCKPFVTPCHLGKLKLAFTSPNVILATGVVPKTFWWAELISQFFCYLYYSKNFTCPSGKLRIGFTSPGLSDTTFFARSVTPQGTRTPNRPAQNCNPITSPWHQATVRTTTCDLEPCTLYNQIERCCCYSDWWACCLYVFRGNKDRKKRCWSCSWYSF